MRPGAACWERLLCAEQTGVAAFSVRARFVLRWACSISSNYAKLVVGLLLLLGIRWSGLRQFLPGRWLYSLDGGLAHAV